MDDMSQILEKGTLLVVETGCYSDSRWAGPVRMLVSATKEELASQFRREWRPEHSWQDANRPDADEFLPWLVKAGKAESVDNVTAWHVGDYGFEV